MKLFCLLLSKMKEISRRKNYQIKHGIFDYLGACITIKLYTQHDNHIEN